MAASQGYTIWTTLALNYPHKCVVPLFHSQETLVENCVLLNHLIMKDLANNEMIGY